MAESKFATLVDARPLGPAGRLLRFAVDEGTPLGFAGGQYVIFHTELVLPNGKAVKRPYSILSADGAQDAFEVALRRIPAGPGSNMLHDLAVGARIGFSGPWGKFAADPAVTGAPMGPGLGKAKPTHSEPLRGSAPSACTLVVATDTGITAALGLVSGQALAPRLYDVHLIWACEPDQDFMPASFVRDRLPAGLGSFTIAALPPVKIGDKGPERATAAVAALGTALARLGVAQFAAAHLVGDGGLLQALSASLVAAGVPAERIKTEGFFNNPERRATS